MAEGSLNGGCAGGCGGGDHHQHQQQRLPKTPATVGKGKSCTGCLYYSSVSKMYGHNPRCVGITRTLPQVPLHRVGEAEMEANEEGRSLSSGFKYSCVGYSVFLDNKDKPNDKGENRPELPSCVGIEILVAKPSTSHHAPAHVHSKEDNAVHSLPRAQKPAMSPRDEFLSRFQRNAGLVALGVTKNLKKVGNYVKDTLDDMMYPYGRRPK